MNGKHYSKPLLSLPLLTLFLLAGCQFGLDDTARATGDEGVVEFSAPGPDFESPIAVGSHITLNLTAQNSHDHGSVESLESYEFDPPGVFEVLEEQSLALQIEAIDAGETHLYVETLHADGEIRADRIGLIAADVHRAEFHPDCSNQPAFLIDQTYEGRLRLYDDEDNDLRGEGLHPLTVEPQDSLTWGPASAFMKLAFQTPDTPQAIEIIPDSGPTLQFPVIESEDANGIHLDWIALDRSEENRIEENEDLFFMNETPYFAIKRLFDERTVCERQGSYRVTVETPDRCFLYSNDNEPVLEYEAEYVEATFISGTLFALGFSEPGECSIEITDLSRSDDAPMLVEHFSWPVEPDVEE